MKISYSSNKLEKQLTDIRLMKKYYSNDFVKLRNRLSELAVASNLAQVSELPPPRRHKLKGDRDACWGIDISKNDRIVLRPVGAFDIHDLESITEIEIIEIEDYH